MITDVPWHYTLTPPPADAAGRFSFEPLELDGQPTWDSCLAPRILWRPT